MRTEPVCYGEKGRKTEWISLQESAGKVCAKECGLFPPCIPLLRKGETISKSKLNRLAKAASAFGLKEGKILVYSEA